MSNSITSSSIRKFSEDSRLRPFLSAHFDVQNYLKTIVEKNKSEECLTEISVLIEEVNEEIKSYISMHKDDLMSGMQDVASLAEKYQSLSLSASNLVRYIERLKKEVIYILIVCL